MNVGKQTRYLEQGRISSKVLFLFVILFIVGVILAIWGGRKLPLVVQCGCKPPVDVVIPEGSSFKEILEILEQNGVVKHPGLFILYVRLQRGERKIRAGYYRFEGVLTSKDLFSILERGQVIYETFTVREGWDKYDIAQYFVKRNLAKNEDEALRIIDSPSFLQKVREKFPDAPDIEGFLYPSTYYVALPVSIEKVLIMMIKQSLGYWTKERIDKSRKMGMTPYEVLILASLVEKETSRHEERPLIARVFLNRLKLGMRLECDPTVIYAWKRKGYVPIPLTRKDLQVDSPYNTYRRMGLPPSPIASPTVESIDAVLSPVDGNWLYFVADGKGGHRFAHTYREHLKNVRQYKRMLRSSR